MVWRKIHLKDTDYKIYSCPHSIYSRIDYLFIPSNESFRALDCQIHNITLSDHAPVTVEWDVGWTVSSSRWRLSSSLLGILAIQASLRDELVLYLELNDEDDFPSITLWEAAKEKNKSTSLNLKDSDVK